MWFIIVMTGEWEIEVGPTKRRYSMKWKKTFNFGFARTNCSKKYLEGFFQQDFFKPEVLIEICRFRMFLVMPDHLRRPYPLEQGWPSECRVILGISNVIRNSCGHPCSRGVRSASDDPTSPKTCGIDVSR